MRKLVLLVSLMFLGMMIGCAPARRAESGLRDTQLAVVEAGDGVEVQAPEAWRAEEYMRRRCPHGFTVVKRQEVVAHLARVTSDAFDQLGEPSEISGEDPVHEQRVTFKCRPLGETGESAAVISANVE